MKTMTWQTIDTAPKDGTFVLLSGGKCEENYDTGDKDESDRPVVR